jgi:hypothetical protein
MTHSIEVWRPELGVAEPLCLVFTALAEADLPLPEEDDAAVVELSRQYPSLSREVAEYLAR